ncbi:hypothetical protein D5086_000172 [Populus alba]|uniref:Uncharacterized protein n=1 Tax=Populus alba TaxID=43335 RepID=A0ACC4CV29_POPAL
MHGNSEGIIDLGHMRDLTTLGSLENHKVMTVPENIGKEKQVDAPNKTGDVSDSMKNKRARKSEEIHAMINPLTLQDREGQLNREKNGSRTLVQSRKIRGKGEGPSRIGRNLPTGAFWEKGKEKLANMKSNLEALSNISHLHTERGDKECDTRMILGPGNETDQYSLGNPNRIGAGGLIRSSAGNFLVGFIAFAGVACNLLPELLAIAKGLKLAWDRGYRKIICHSDSKDALRLLSANQLTTTCDNGLMIWDEPPQGLQQLLLADIMGISFPRIV